MLLLETSSKSYPRHQGIRSPKTVETQRVRGTRKEKERNERGGAAEARGHRAPRGSPAGREDRACTCAQLHPRGVCPTRRPHSTVSTVHVCVPGAQVGMWDAHLS